MKSSFTEIFIRRPVLAIVVNLVIVIAGGQAIFSALSGDGDFTVRQYPRSENASVSITTVYVGASADLVRGFVTSPLERAIAAADGIEYLESSSSQSISTITARLKLNYDPTKALAEISSKVDQVRADLPPESEVPIINVETADSQFAQMYLQFGSDLLEANEVTDYLVRVVQPALTAVTGVQKAEILGGRTYAMRIWLKPERMAALEVSPTQIRQALASNNYLSAVGQTKGSYIQVNLTTNTNLTNVADFQQIPIKEDDNTIVRLEDVADIVLGAENYGSDVRFSGQKAVFMGVWVLPTANSLDVIARVRAEVESLKARFPVGFSGGVAYDATKYIDDSINEVIKTLLETLGIVVLVIFIFLGRIRTVIVPVITIPVSLIGAVFLMQVAGFSVNLLTLLAIVLSVGLVVDDAIVVVENVERHLREGKSPVDAAILSARELVGPIIAMTLTLAAVYAPIAAQGGLTGSLFREFAVTLAGAVLISGFVALTLSPMMASVLLTAAGEEKGLAGAINRGFDRLRNFYGKLLDSSLRARPAVYIVWFGLGILILPLLILSMMSTELAPAEDQGIIFGVVNGPSNATLEQSAHYTSQIQDVFESVPEYDYSFQITFPGGGFGGMITKPWNERDRSIFEIRQAMMPGLSSIPGVTLFPILPASLPGASNFPVEFILASTADTEQIYAVAQEIAAKATQSGLFAFPPELDLKIDLPQSEIVIDRDKVAALGLNLQQVGADMGSMFGAGYVNRFSRQGRSYKVIPQIKRMDRLNPEQLTSIYVTGPKGSLVPLSTFATVKNSTEPRSLNRFNQLNAVKISGIPMAPLDTALKTMEDAAREVMPQGYTIEYGGESRQLRKASGGFLQLFGLALVLIFLVLAAQFNSFRDPFIILAGSAPMAMFGALLFTALRAPGDPWTPHWTWGWTTSWNIYSQVGLITLIGLVAKNAILIVEFANAMQRKGSTKLEAIRAAGRTRLRPILMTSAATVFGHIMLIFVTGAGAGARNSIGLVLVNGMAIGTFFTLFVIPSVYMLIAKDRKSGTVGRAAEATE